MKQGTMHRSTSHLMHLYTVHFLWLWKEHRQQCSGVILLAIVCYGYFCWGFLLLLLLLFFFFLFLFLFFSSSSSSSSSSSKYSSNIASFCTWFLGSVSNQNFSYVFLIKFYLIFFWPLLKTHNHLPCLLLCMTRHSFRHVIPVSMNIFYNDSKTDLKLRYYCCIKIPAIWGCPRRCYYTDGCMLHVTAPQPLQITPALQQACLWALL